MTSSLLIFIFRDRKNGRNEKRGRISGSREKEGEVYEIT